MLRDPLVFLRDHLNAHLATQLGWDPEESQEDKVVFLDGQNMDPIPFKLDAVSASALMINLEEDNTLRAPDPYVRTEANGTRRCGTPYARPTCHRSCTK